MRLYGAGLLHLIIEAVLGLFTEMDGACAFFMSIMLALPAD